MPEAQEPAARYNPWKGIFYTPGKAFEQIVQKNPYTDLQFWLVFLLSVILLSLKSLLMSGSRLSIDFLSPAGLVALLVMGLTFLSYSVFCLFISTVLFGSLAKWLGRLMGGTGTYGKMYAVLNWANLPFLLIVALSLLADFLGEADVAAFFNMLQPQDTLFLFAAVMLWTVWLVGLGYAKAHNISVKKGMLLSFIAYGLPLLVEYAFIPWQKH